MSDIICKLDGTHSHSQLAPAPAPAYRHMYRILARNVRKLHQINRKLESSVTFTLIGPQIVLSDINFNIIGLSI